MNTVKKVLFSVLLLFGFISFISSTSFTSLALKESEIKTVYDLLESGELYKTDQFLGLNDATIQYAKYGNQKGKKGSIVFVNGINDNIFKYIETYHDLFTKGYSPIYVMDHRGQGFSDRLGENPEVIHVDSFEDYQKDLNTFINKIVLKDKQIDRHNLYAIGHSMGGAVLIDYLQSQKESPFRRVVLSAPLVRIKTYIPYSVYETVMLPVFKNRCSTCFDEKVWHPFGKQIIEFFNVPTTSRARFYFTMHVSNKYNIPTVAKPSYGWFIEASKMYKLFLDETRIHQMDVEMLILQAKKETLVSNKHQDIFCSKLGYDLCRLKALDGKHELLLERDSIRDKALSEILNFFEKS